MSRSSVVYRPFSIVWGLGCAFLTAILYRIRNKNDSYTFFAGTLLGGVYEYICSVFTELVFGTVFWDYSKFAFNLEAGLICSTVFSGELRQLYG
ncbi:MAG: putative ABC transporter permease [Lachnospiraceae bacterium]